MGKPQRKKKEEPAPVKQSPDQELDVVEETSGYEVMLIQGIVY